MTALWVYPAQTPRSSPNRAFEWLEPLVGKDALYLAGSLACDTCGVRSGRSIDDRRAMSSNRRSQAMFGAI